MPTFTVLCRVDAYVDCLAEVKAPSAEEAALLAEDAPHRYKWEELGPVEFDARGYVTLDGDHNEIERTKTGYFG